MTVSRRSSDVLQTHYKTILTKSEAVLADLCADTARLSAFTAAHNRAADLEAISSLLDNRPEAHIFKLACVEYQHSLYSVAFGQYRQAHVSLRLFLELCLTTILFSAHEVDCRLWLLGKKDINWNSIVKNDNGIFSKQFIRAFFEGMEDYSEQYCVMAETLYRECSEFVHGNRQSYEGLDSGIVFRPELMGNWTDRAETALRIVAFCFACRYLRLTTLKIRNKLEHMILEMFGEITPIQAIYQETGA